MAKNYGYLGHDEDNVIRVGFAQSTPPPDAKKQELRAYFPMAEEYPAPKEFGALSGIVSFILFVVCVLLLVQHALGLHILNLTVRPITVVVFAFVGAWLSFLWFMFWVWSRPSYFDD